MKFRPFALALLFTALSSTAFAEGYVGAGSGGPLLSANGCVMSANGVSFPECGSKAEVTPPVAAAKPVTRVIIDCSKCNQAQQKRPAPKKVNKAPAKQKSKAQSKQHSRMSPMLHKKLRPKN